MRASIICPAVRDGVAAFAKRSPLALLPLLGRNVLDWHLAEIFHTGGREVRVSAADRPELIRRYLRDGEPWGLRIELTPLAEEPLPADGEIVADHLRDTGDCAFASYRAWFETVRAAFRRGGAGCIGMREFAKDVWVHVHAVVDSAADLAAPCWIGARTRVGADARIGPGAYVEDDCTIECGATICESWVGPRTFVGAYTELAESLAWGGTLCKWTTGAVTEVADSFLLGEVSAVRSGNPTSIFTRAVAALAALATSPIALLALGAGIIRRKPFLIWKEAVMLDGSVSLYAEFGALGGALARWPRLLAILGGSFAWFGNPPLSRAEARTLEGEFEQLRLTVPPGLVSLGDSLGCAAALGDEATAHAGYYAASRSWRLNAQIAGRLIARAICGAPVTVPAQPIEHE